MRAARANLTGFFSLSTRPHQFTAITAPLSASDFFKAKPTGLPVDDD
jgi:hypothetical protein